MHKLGQRRFYQGLHFKLLLLSLTLLLLPWTGFRYLNEMESLLREIQEEQLMGQTALIAELMAPETNAYLQQTLLTEQQLPVNALYAHPLQQPVQLDGYASEWQGLLTQQRHFLASETNPKAMAFDLLIGFRDSWLYLMIQVADPEVVYATSDKLPRSGDHLLIALPGTKDETRQWVLSTTAPGWVVARDLQHGEREHSIRGEWQETVQGYNLEIRLPLAESRQHISLALVDIDQPDQPTPSGVAATSGLQQNSQLSTIVMPSTAIAQRLAQLTPQDNRIRIINAQRLVVAQSGVLPPSDRQDGRGLFPTLLNLLLPVPETDVPDPRHNLGRLDGPEIRRALEGEVTTYRHRDRETDLTVLSAAHPVTQGSKIIGAVVIEQTTQEILLLQRSALERLLSSSFLLLLLTVTVLLLFASRLTARITGLSQRINRAVSSEGRIQGGFYPHRQRDEIGELERHFAAVMQRMQEYHHYLEALGSRLAHEFRTPLVMVKSSLENLTQDDDVEARKRYLSRATEGIERLNLILNSMREASRLEQSLPMVQCESLNLTDFMHTLSESYHNAFPHIQFQCETPAQPILANVAPDLMAQAFDKLISNAIDFHTPGTAITLKLELDVVTDTANLQVINQGPFLPDGMGQELFESLTSVRHTTDQEPHLGLGLYLARLIAEFHKGKIAACNTAEGVCFSIDLPIHPAGSHHP